MSATLEALTRAIDAVTQRPQGPARHARGLVAAVSVLLAHRAFDEAARAAAVIPTLAPTQWLDAHVQLGLGTKDEPGLVSAASEFVERPPITTGTGRGGDELRAAVDVLPRFEDVPAHPALAKLVTAMRGWAMAGQRQREPAFFARALGEAVETCVALDGGRRGPWRAHAVTLCGAIVIDEERALASSVLDGERPPRQAPRPAAETLAGVLAQLAPQPRGQEPFAERISAWRSGASDAASLLTILRTDPTPDEGYAVRTPRDVFHAIAAHDDAVVREALAVVLDRRFVIKSADVLVPAWPTPSLDALGYDDANAHTIGALLAPWAARLGGDVAERVVGELLGEVVRRGPPPSAADPTHSGWWSHEHRLFEAVSALDARGLVDVRWLDALPETSRWVRWAVAGSAGLEVPAMRASWGEPPAAVCVVVVHRLAKAGRFEDALVMARVEDPYCRQALGHCRVASSHDTLLTLARSADAITPARAEALGAAMAKAKRFRTGDAMRAHRECTALLEAILCERGAT